MEHHERVRASRTEPLRQARECGVIGCEQQSLLAPHAGELLAKSRVVGDDDLLRLAAQVALERCDFELLACQDFDCPGVRREPGREQSDGRRKGDSGRQRVQRSQGGRDERGKRGQQHARTPETAGFE